VYSSTKPSPPALKPKAYTLKPKTPTLNLNAQVLLWKKNVDQVFEGVEECPICYTVCHTFASALPLNPQPQP
jgi:hypothetical protein